MPIPLSLLLGLLALGLQDWVAPPLPGAGSAPWLLLFSPLLLLPFACTRLADQRLLRAARRGRVTIVPRLRLLLPALVVPAAYLAFLEATALTELAQRWAPGSAFLRLLLVLTPLIVMEWGVRVAELGSARAFERAELGRPAFLGAERIPLALLIVVPLLLVTMVLDLAFRARWLEVFVGSTSLGMLAGVFALGLALAVVMPLTFRAVFPLRTRLPILHEATVRATARALDFPARAVLLLATGHREVNAALVRVLPRPAYLVLTDGLLSLLDPDAVRGVVAHEVGHARGNHSLWLLLLFVAIPALLTAPMLVLGIEQWPWRAQAPLALLVVLLGVTTLRRIAHRFELEADQLAVTALGSAEPCIRALSRLGELAPHATHRATLRHPSEHTRLAHLERCAAEPGYVARFVARGRRLRGALALGLLGALLAAAPSHAWLWARERPGLLFELGRFPESQAALAALPETDDDGVRSTRAELRELLGAALELAPAGGEWRVVMPSLAAKAWQRGLEVLAADGPERALPYFHLVLGQEAPTPLERTVYLWCSAMAEHKGGRAAELREHLTRLEPGPELVRALAPW